MKFKKVIMEDVWSVHPKHKYDDLLLDAMKLKQGEVVELIAEVGDTSIVSVGDYLYSAIKRRGFAEDLKLFQRTPENKQARFFILKL